MKYLFRLYILISVYFILFFISEILSNNVAQKRDTDPGYKRLVSIEESYSRAKRRDRRNIKISIVYAFLSIGYVIILARVNKDKK